jgi:uncharacterized SAM-binding protein YcdF (DUF218 family)
MAGGAPGSLRRGRRRFGLLAALLACGGLLFAGWFAGFLWFVGKLPGEVADPLRRTDAIVVLTGGSGRVRRGLDLLADKRAAKLFVSGVYRGVDVAELLRVSQRAPEELSCCVALGHEAETTHGNAIETAQWVRDNGFASLRLVTAAYHMPRSMMEFRRLMPGVEIVPHPVFPEHVKQDDWWRWPGSTYLLLGEYTKYLVAVVRVAVSPLPQDPDS